MNNTLFLLLGAALSAPPLFPHDAHGRSSAPPEAKRLKNPIPNSPSSISDAAPLYARLCSSCHGPDGRPQSRSSPSAPRPTDLTNYLMESMRDGEIFYVISHGIDKRMPPFASALSEPQRWQLVHFTRSLRLRRRAIEKSLLGPYDWQLPPGFPFPVVPKDNPMTQAKVTLGRYLFYDKRLSLNQTQSCASCHLPDHAFADNRAQGRGSTGELHPRSPMSLVNVAYSPTFTWANPLVRSLEEQALVPLFGDHPIELGMSGKEDLLLLRLRRTPIYRKLFPAAFPNLPDPFSIRSITHSIASFERTILSAGSPYDRYQRGDDPSAISDSAKRGESLFFSERLECFHCHGGFNLTGSINYLDKGFPEIEFHNTGLYNLPGPFSYPQPNLGLFEFTRQPSDIGKFKAPTLRNIALTAPYMHDGSVPTLHDAIHHYSDAGRSIPSGPRAGIGADNPNKSEFIKGFQLSPAESADLLAFLHSLTDPTIASNPALSDPFRPLKNPPPSNAPKHFLTGTIVNIFPADNAISLFHDAVPGFMPAMNRPYAMEFTVAKPQQLKNLKPGMPVRATVRRQGSDYILEDLRPGPRKPQPK